MAFITQALPVHQPQRRSSRALMCAAPPVSPLVSSLIRQQIQNPIFDPSLLQAPLSETLQELQTTDPPQFHYPAPDSPPTAAARLIAEYNQFAISAARRQVLLIHPGISSPGGALYPAYRAAACWRDLTAFARVVGYYLTAGEGFSDVGVTIMQQIYNELSVPLDAMRTGVAATRDELISFTDDDDVTKALQDGFDVLLRFLRF